MKAKLPSVYSSFSSSFVSPLFPRKGESVSLSIAFSSKPESVLLKYDSQSGLVFMKEMREDGTYNGSVKYTAETETNLDDTLFRYFFVFFLEGASYYYSRSGITRYVPSVHERFSLITGDGAPSWVASSTCYQIFPDRFFNSDPDIGAKKGEYEFDGGVVTTPSWNEKPRPWNESRCCDFYNGDLKGIEEKAGYLKGLGIDLIYINPIFSSESVHRYDTVDFFRIDPKLGGDEALISLVDTMHRNGIRVVLDISINHTGLNGVWLKKAIEDPRSDEHDFFYFNEDGSFSCWQDVKTLPQLRYSSQKLRDYMYRSENSVMKKYLKAPYNIDGWRLDVAPEVGRRGSEQLCRDVWRDVQKELRKVKKDLYLVGEDWDDSTLFLEGDMWNGTMNYYGSGRPLRGWMGEMDRFLGERDGHSPGLDRPLTGEELSSFFRAAVDSVPGQTPYMQMNLFDSHDTPRLHNHSEIFDRDIYKGVQMALYMLPGFPNTYYGDEILLDGTLESNEGARYPMEWREERQDGDMKEWMTALGKVRKEKSLAYASSSFVPLDDEAMAVVRAVEGKAWVAVINRGAERSLSLPLTFLPRKKAEKLLGRGKAEIRDSSLLISVKEHSSLLISLV